jgi:tryptophan halogenase
LKITVVGGGAAGSMAAAYVKKKFPEYEVCMIYTDSIPAIGVGESVTPYISVFFNDLEIPESEWMLETGSIYKYANCFENWTDKDTKQFFAFSYNEPMNKILANKSVSWEDMRNLGTNDFRSTDVWIDLFNNNLSTNFSKDFNVNHEFMESLKSPFDNNQYIHHKFSYAYHVDAEKICNYLKDNFCKKLGVKTIKQKIVNAEIKDDCILSVKLENGDIHTSDYWLDASGQHRILINYVNTELKLYDTPCNSAWVAPLRYVDQENEMKNYTRSIWNEKGWIFKIGLIDRMGCGLVYSDKYFNDNRAKKEFLQIIDDQNIAEPRNLKWTPARLKTPAVGNVFPIGMTAGFVEPLEANALYIIWSSIKCFERYLNENNIDDFNHRVSYTIDDIADFIDVHYTLCPRGDYFWEEQRTRGAKNNHTQLIKDKYNHKLATLYSATQQYTMFPEYMWLELASTWIGDLGSWSKNIDKDVQNKYLKYLNDRKNKLYLQCNQSRDYLDFMKDFHGL